MESDCQFLLAPPPRMYAAPGDDGQFLQQQQQQLSGGGAGERKRRFTEEQVRSLESTFHTRRAKLDPREKAELARELGLQPRQVAIWFQNKRARWRSKQLEQDFAELRGHYDALRARVESLKQEKLTLAAQLEELKKKLDERQDQSASCGGSCAVADVDDKRITLAAASRRRMRARRRRQTCRTAQLRAGTSMTTTWCMGLTCTSRSAPLRSCGRRHGRWWSGTQWH
ncbi:hypothetical protein CFC21_088737, partial [Triticum aestivum]